MSSLPRTTATNKTHTRAIPIFLRGTDKVIGRVIGGTFAKVIQGSRHLLRTPAALGFDLSTLEDAERAGAVDVAVTDSDTGRVYRQTIETIRRYGFPVTRGHGRQWALSLDHYSVDGAQPDAERRAADTNQQRKELQLGLFGGAA